jgi:hypothetical protein
MLDQTHLWIASHNLARTVLRAIIYDDDFQFLNAASPQRGPDRQDPFYDGGDTILLVVSWYDD